MKRSVASLERSHTFPLSTSGQIAASRPAGTGPNDDEGSGNAAQYLPILTMVVLVILFVSVSFVASIILGVKRPTKAKTAPFECGVLPESDHRVGNAMLRSHR